jgi:hypothetical protein
MQQAGFDISLWLRKPRLLTIKFAHRQLQFQPASAPISAVLIPVKSYAVTETVQTLLPAMASDAQLVLSHNGMGTIEQVKPMLAPGHGLWFLTTTHGALKQPDTVQHTGTGSSTLAALNNAAKVKQQRVLQTGHQCRDKPTDSTVQLSQWRTCRTEIPPTHRSTGHRSVQGCSSLRLSNVCTQHLANRTTGYQQYCAELLINAAGFSARPTYRNRRNNRICSTTGGAP